MQPAMTQMALVTRWSGYVPHISQSLRRNRAKKPLNSIFAALMLTLSLLLDKVITAHSIMLFPYRLFSSRVAATHDGQGLRDGSENCIKSEKNTKCMIRTCTHSTVHSCTITISRRPMTALLINPNLISTLVYYKSELTN